MKFNLSILLLLAFVALSELAFAQKFSEHAELIINESQQVAAIGEWHRDLGSDGQYRYYGLWWRGKMTISKVDRKGQLVKEVTQKNISAKGGKYGIVCYSLIDSALYCIVDKKIGGNTELYIVEIDQLTLNAKGIPKKLLSIGTRNTAFRFFPSDDGSKLLIVSRENVRPIDVENIGFEVVGKGGISVWAESIEMPGVSQVNEIQSFLVTSEGNVVIVANSWKDWKEKGAWESEGGNQNSYYAYFVYDGGKSKKQTYLDEDERRTKNFSITVNERGQLVCAGTYANTEDAEIVGSMIKFFDLAAGTHIRSTYTEFKFPVLHVLSDRYDSTSTSKPSKTRYDNLCSKILRLQDGGYAIVVEQQISGTQEMMSRNGSMYYTYRDDLILIRWDLAGVNLHQNKFRRRQREEYGGYGFWEYSDKICLGFEKHFSLEVVDENGMIGDVVLQKESEATGDRKFIPLYSIVYCVGDNVFGIPMKRDDLYSLGILTIGN